MISNTYIGRLTKDVSTSVVGENNLVLNNRLAISIGKDKTTFVDVVAWGSTAELIEKHYKKGFEILFQGHLINKSNTINNFRFDITALQIDDVIFTYGNPRDPKLPENFEPDFLG